MKMLQMMLLYVFLISFSYINPRDIDEDIFYGENVFLKKLEDKKLHESLLKETYKKNIKPNIKNLDNYINIISKEKEKNFFIMQKGNCALTQNLSEVYGEKNIMDLELFMNDKNYLFNDYNKDILIYSTCKSFFSKCEHKILYVSRKDFSFYEFTMSGEKIPNLVDFMIDIGYDKTKQKNVKNNLIFSLFTFMVE